MDGGRAEEQVQEQVQVHGKDGTIFVKGRVGGGGGIRPIMDPCAIEFDCRWSMEGQGKTISN